MALSYAKLLGETMVSCKMGTLHLQIPVLRNIARVRTHAKRPVIPCKQPFHASDCDGALARDLYVCVAANITWWWPWRKAVALVRELVLRGCSANTADGNGMTALQHAAAAGTLEVAKLLQQLCEGKLCIDTADNSGWTPLMTGTVHSAAWTPRL